MSFLICNFLTEEGYFLRLHNAFIVQQTSLKDQEKHLTSYDMTTLTQVLH